MDVKSLAFLQIGFCLLYIGAAKVLPTKFDSPYTQTNSAVQSMATTKLLEAIKREQEFHTLVFWRRASADCFTELTNSHIDNLLGAKLIFDNNFTIYLNSLYNRELFNIVCFSDAIDYNLLANVAESLEHMRETRVLFMLQNFTKMQANEWEEVFTYCDQQQMLNVLAVHEDYSQTGRFYTFNRFPKFTVEMLHWPSVYYTNRLRNLQGYALRSIPSQSEPGSIIYTDHQGRKHSSGYIYHLIETFAQKLNASLVYKRRVNVGESIEMSILQELTRNYEFDLPICLQMPVMNESLYGFSDIVEISDWMPMLPRAGYVERYKMYHLLISNYTLLIDWLIFVIFSVLYRLICESGAVDYRRRRDPKRLSFATDMLFNDKIFRGIIGLSHPLHRRVRSYKLYLLSVLLFVYGTIWTTSYSGELDAYYSRPPTGEQIQSFDDLLARHIKIAIPQEEFELLEKLMPAEFMRLYNGIFLIIPELRDFYALRKSFNTNFGYAVHSVPFAMIDQQQHYFSQRLFRIADGVQFRRQILMAVPLAENSVYRSAFGEYLLHIHAYGFWNYWTAMSLYEMAAAGKLNFVDLSQLKEYEALCVKDFYYIWLLYVFGNILSCCCILAEVLHRRLVFVNLPRVCQEYLFRFRNSL